MNTIATLPDSCFLRLNQIVGNPKATPPILPLIPVSKSTWWAWVKCGRAPSPVKLGARVTVWNAREIHAWMNAAGIRRVA